MPFRLEAPVLLRCTWDLGLFQYRVLLFWNTCIEQVGSHAATVVCLAKPRFRSTVGDFIGICAYSEL